MEEEEEEEEEEVYEEEMEEEEEEEEEEEITKFSARCTVSRHSRSRGLLGELRNGQM